MKRDVMRRTPQVPLKGALKIRGIEKNDWWSVTGGAPSPRTRGEGWGEGLHSFTRSLVHPER